MANDSSAPIDPTKETTATAGPSNYRPVKRGDPKCKQCGGWGYFVTAYGLSKEIDCGCVPNIRHPGDTP